MTKNCVETFLAIFLGLFFVEPFQTVQQVSGDLSKQLWSFFSQRYGETLNSLLMYVQTEVPSDS